MAETAGRMEEDEEEEEEGRKKISELESECVMRADPGLVSGALYTPGSQAG